MLPLSPILLGNCLDLECWNVLTINIYLSVCLSSIHPSFLLVCTYHGAHERAKDNFQESGFLHFTTWIHMVLAARTCTSWATLSAQGKKSLLRNSTIRLKSHCPLSHLWPSPTKGYEVTLWKLLFFHAYVNSFGIVLHFIVMLWATFVSCFFHDPSCISMLGINKSLEF